MPDPNSFDLNNQPRAADAMPQIPTSTSEVEVRTMASDLEMMGKSGGMVNQSAPTAMQVPVEFHQAAEPPEPPAGRTASPPSGKAKVIIITAIVLLVFVGLFALGYFVLGR